MTQPLPNDPNPIAADPGSTDQLQSFSEEREQPSDPLETPPQSESGAATESDAALELGFEHAAQKVRSFPQSPGIYLMKDRFGRVIYIGKAKNLRSRAGSYFLKAAAADQRTADWIGEIADIDYMLCDSEVDALLSESRLIKDIQPKHNRDLKDDKSFPYLMITTREDFPRVEITREPRQKGVKLYGPFPDAGAPARCGRSAAADFQVPHLLAGHRRARGKMAMVSSLPVGEHRPVHRSVQPADQQGGLPPRHPPSDDLLGGRQGEVAARNACRNARREQSAEL